MNKLLIALTFLITNFCYSQNEFDILDKAEAEFYNQNYEKAIILYSQLIKDSSSLNISNYYYGRAESKYFLKDYEGSLIDINESLNRHDDFCPALHLRGLLKLKFNDRDGACLDWKKANNLCINYSKEPLRIQCDRTWNYGEVHQVYYLDKKYIEESISGAYLTCQKIIYDTTYYLKWDFRFKGNWEVFYDLEFKIKQADYFIKNDTAYAIIYFPNGQKKSEKRHDDQNLWIYNAEWCINGQQIFGSNPNDKNYRSLTTFYCNGNKKWKGNIYQGKAFGLHTQWYENGQKQSEEYYTEFNKDLANQRLLKDSLVSQKFWDKQGNVVQPPVNEVAVYNKFTTPKIKLFKEEKIVPYYNIKNQKEYDNSMSLFQEKVYKVANFKNNCHCKVGIIYASFIVDKEGRIINCKLTNGLDECAEKAFVEAINEIKKWQPATFEGQLVNTSVFVGLKLEGILK